jgi:thiol-disulfide isomerase/thioredoxin
MNYLTVAVIGVAVLGLVNLWLTVAMARRVREQGEQLARRTPARVPRPAVGLPPGAAVPDFSVTTVSGTVVSAAGLRGERSLIGFFMPGCAPCHEQIPAFLAFARSLPGGPAHTLAVVTGGGRPAARVPDQDSDRLIQELTEAAVAQVVREPSTRVVTTALAVTGYPSFFVLDADGRVQAGAHGIAGLSDHPALAALA